MIVKKDEAWLIGTGLPVVSDPRWSEFVENDENRMAFQPRFGVLHTSEGLYFLP